MVGGQPTALASYACTEQVEISAKDRRIIAEPAGITLTQRDVVSEDERRELALSSPPSPSR